MAFVIIDRLLMTGICQSFTTILLFIFLNSSMVYLFMVFMPNILFLFFSLWIPFQNLFFLGFKERKKKDQKQNVNEWWWAVVQTNFQQCHGHGLSQVLFASWGLWSLIYFSSPIRFWFMTIYILIVIYIRLTKIKALFIHKSYARKLNLNDDNSSVIFDWVHAKR